MRTRGVSIIIPCYQAGWYLMEAVDSVHKQPFQCLYECIVIDDGSSDYDTVEALKVVEKMKNTIVIRLKRNRGAQYARNEGLRASKFDYVFSIDADDHLNTDPKILRDGTYADQAIQVLEEQPDVAFVHAISCMFGDFHGYTISAYPVTATQILHKHHAQNSIIYRKAEAIKAGFYDESILKWQDWSFAVSLLNARFKQSKKNQIHFFEVPFYRYRIHSNPDRVSFQNLNEKEFVKITIEKNKEIYSSMYSDLTIEQMTEKVMASKPNKLTDLLYTASHNIHTALKMAEQRGYMLTSEIEPHHIP